MIGASSARAISNSLPAVDPPLIFVRLLIADANHRGKLILSQAKHDPPFADTPSDMIVDRAGWPPLMRFSHARHPYKWASSAPIFAQSRQRDKGQLIPTAQFPDKDELALIHEVVERVL